MKLSERACIRIYENVPGVRNMAYGDFCKIAEPIICYRSRAEKTFGVL